MKVFITCETLSERTAQTTQIIEMATNFEKLGHQVQIFCPSNRKYGGNKRLNLIYVPTVNVFMLTSIIYQLFLLICISIYYPISKPNIIYTRMGIFSLTPLFFSKIFKIPHIIRFGDDIVEDMKIQNKNPFFVAIYKIIESINCKFSSKITAVTSNIKDTLQKRWLIPFDKIVVIPNGANIEVFIGEDIKEARNKLNLKEECYYVEFVGGLERWQGLEYLIRTAPLVLKQISNVKFLIVGDGVMKDRLIKMVKKLNFENSFIFTGSIPYKEISKYVNASDVCVAPFIRGRNEKMGLSPLKIYEYLACGKPVVCSRIPGLELIEDHSAGLLVEPENPEEFANAIIKLLKNKELREKMGTNGRKYVVENCSWEIVARKVAKMCQDTIMECKRS